MIMDRYAHCQKGLLVSVKRISYSQFFIQATFSPDGEELIPLSFAVEVWERNRNEKIQKEALIDRLPLKLKIFDGLNLSIIADMVQKCSEKPEGSVIVYETKKHGILGFKQSYIAQKTRFLSVLPTISGQRLNLTYTDDRAYIFHEFKKPCGTTWADDFALNIELVYGERDMFFAEADNIFKHNDGLEKYVSQRQLEIIWYTAHEIKNRKCLFLEHPDSGEFFMVEPLVF